MTRALFNKGLAPPKTIQLAMLHLARLGGHIGNNGSPGWQSAFERCGYDLPESGSHQSRHVSPSAQDFYFLRTVIDVRSLQL